MLDSDGVDVVAAPDAAVQLSSAMPPSNPFDLKDRSPLPRTRSAATQKQMTVPMPSNAPTVPQFSSPARNSGGGTAAAATFGFNAPSVLTTASQVAPRLGSSHSKQAVAAKAVGKPGVGQSYRAGA